MVDFAKLRSRAALLRGLIDGEAAYTGPAWIALDMTRRCNNVCLGCFFHCVQPREPSPGDHSITDLPLELAQRLALDLARLHTPEVILAGEGEPLLHPRFFEIVTCFKKAGLTVRAFTNGSLIDEAMAQRLAASGLDFLQVTFWAVNEAEHVAWHPGVNPDFLDRRRRGVALLREARRLAGRTTPRINLQMPLNRNSFRNIKERVELALASGCEETTFGFFRDWGGQFENQCLLPEDGEAMREDLLAARKRFDAAGVEHNIDEYLDRVQYGADAWRSFPCYAGWYEAYVKVDGTVVPCGPCNTVMGTLAERSFPEIWNGLAYKEFRRRSSDPRQLERMTGQCNCSNCCLWRDNRKVHRAWRWIAPLVRQRKRAALQ